MAAPSYLLRPSGAEAEVRRMRVGCWGPQLSSNNFFEKNLSGNEERYCLDKKDLPFEEILFCPQGSQRKLEGLSSPWGSWSPRQPPARGPDREPWPAAWRPCYKLPTDCGQLSIPAGQLPIPAEQPAWGALRDPALLPTFRLPQIN